MAAKGDAAELVLKANAGLVCEPENPADLAQKISDLYNMSRQELDEFGANGKRYYYEYLSIEHGTTQMLSVFEKAQGSERS